VSGNQHGNSQRCPLCGRPAEPRWRPFCSRRCADIDLANWLGEAYRIPSEADDDNAARAEPPGHAHEDDEPA
jgi:endogenous inhibitor of DNA gyrase (YacG/DUF329 family)